MMNLFELVKYFEFGFFGASVVHTQAWPDLPLILTTFNESSTKTAEILGQPCS